MLLVPAPSLNCRRQYQAQPDAAYRAAIWAHAITIGIFYPDLTISPGFVYAAKPLCGIEPPTHPAVAYAPRGRIDLAAWRISLGGDASSDSKTDSDSDTDD